MNFTVSRKAMKPSAESTIEQLIRQPEGKQLEFKRDLSSPMAVTENTGRLCEYGRRSVDYWCQ